MIKLIFNSILFAAVIVITAFVFNVSAQTAQGGYTDMAQWDECATKAAGKYEAIILQNPTVFQKDLCGFLDVSVGPQCDSLVQRMQVSGQLKLAVTMFALQHVILPACGEPPRK